ncbi:hypothetical protein [Vibrio sp.]|uniref:hypothetical protein n=1 Tax=Vibrio sp. TaxID=678 RepID=UPI0037B1BF84
MLFDAKDVTVTVVPAPVCFHLVGVRYFAQGFMRADVEGSIKDGEPVFHRVNVGEVGFADGWHELVSELSSIPDSIPIAISSFGAGELIGKELLRHRPNVVLIKDLGQMERDNRYASLPSRTIHRMAESSDYELRLALLNMLEINPLGQWQVKHHEREKALAIFMACSDFYRDLDDGLIFKTEG